MMRFPALGTGLGLGVSLGIVACFSQPPQPAADATSAPLCANQQPAVLFDDFSGTASGDAACGHGGVATNQTSETRDGGLLRFVVPANTVGMAYCTWNAFAAGGGVIVKVASATASDYLTASDFDLVAGDDSFTMYTSVAGGVLKVADTNSSDPNPLGQTTWSNDKVWWRYHVIDATHVDPAYSNDGQEWPAFGATGVWDTGSTADVKLVLGIKAGSATGGELDIDELYVCP